MTRCQRPLQPCERVAAPWDFSTEPDPETAVQNRPTEAGRALGREIARLVDAEEKKQLQLFPDQHPRCVDCAARAGTIPNGCEETLMDFLKCAIEGVDFMCHKGLREGEKPHRPCMGWLILQRSSDENSAISIAQAKAQRLRSTQ